MCSASASADTVINKSTVCVQSGLTYNSLCGKYLEIIHYITLGHETTTILIYSECSAIGKVAG